MQLWTTVAFIWWRASSLYSFWNLLVSVMRHTSTGYCTLMTNPTAMRTTQLQWMPIDAIDVHKQKFKRPELSSTAVGCRCEQMDTKQLFHFWIFYCFEITRCSASFFHGQMLMITFHSRHILEKFSSVHDLLLKSVRLFLFYETTLLNNTGLWR